MAALGGSVARRYAKALFEIGVSSGAFERFGRELDDLTSLYAGSADLRLAFGNPTVRIEEKRAVLQAILTRVGASPAVARFAGLLLARGRMGHLAAIARAYRELSDARAGQVRARVTTAAPLPPVDLDRVRRALEMRTGKKVIIETAIDPDLVAGVVARVGDLVLDGSVRTRLSEMRRRLLN